MNFNMKPISFFYKVLFVSLVAVAYQSHGSTFRQSENDGRALPANSGASAAGEPVIADTPENAPSATLSGIMSRYEFLEALTKYMGSYEREQVIEAVAKVPAESYKAFIETVNVLSANLSEFSRLLIIRDMAKVPAESYKAFIEAVNAPNAPLTQGMDESVPQKLIAAMVNLPANIYNDFYFIKAFNALSKRMDRYELLNIIKAFVVFPASQHSQFTEMLNILVESAGIKKDEITAKAEEYLKIFEMLTKIRTDYYPHVFSVLREVPDYLKKVPFTEFKKALQTPNMDQKQIFLALNNLYQKYNPQKDQATSVTKQPLNAAAAAAASD